MAETIGQVIDELTAIITWSIQHDSRLGYFPALYRKVTVRLRDQIAASAFDDNARMQRLGVIFANRYLDAVQRWQTGATPTQSWHTAFVAASAWRPTVIQHLLLGMNAHINLDLGVAAAMVAPGPALPSLRGDFNRINEILADLVDDVQRDLSEVWPPLRILLQLIRRSDDLIVNFSMTRARDAAWSFAEQLNRNDSDSWSAHITARDRTVARFANAVSHPGYVLSTALLAIRAGERDSNAHIISLLE